MHGLIPALRLMTRLPVPFGDRSADTLADANPWFPAAGLVVGLFVAAMVGAGTRIDPWLGAFLGLLGWVWVTGALHLDGLADLVDALGAAHGDRERFLAVLREAHLGGFAVVAVVLQLLGKLVLLMLLARSGTQWLVVLVCGWARLGATVWVWGLPPLTSGLGMMCAAGRHDGAVFAWILALGVASFLFSPVLLLAPLLLLGWWWFLKRRVGGMNGDCLGAGIEVVETTLLLAWVIWEAT